MENLQLLLVACDDSNICKLRNNVLYTNIFHTKLRVDIKFSIRFSNIAMVTLLPDVWGTDGKALELLQQLDSQRRAALEAGMEPPPIETSDAAQELAAVLGSCRPRVKAADSEQPVDTERMKAYAYLLLPENCDRASTRPGVCYLLRRMFCSL